MIRPDSGIGGNTVRLAARPDQEGMEDEDLETHSHAEDAVEEAAAQYSPASVGQGTPLAEE